MTAEEAVNFYHSLERFGIIPGLDRIMLLAKSLGSPHKKLKFIHVAGTNGKGSTCTALASILTKAGYKTGLYTSPYVIDFRERIQINMHMISPDDLIRVTEAVKTAVEALAAKGVKITEFEAVTAGAMLYYAQEHCDYVVLETGLGGRFDATNIIQSPLCSIITSVSLDHVKILGNTLAEIAFEKCGIIKEGCPVITGAQQTAEVLEVIKAQAEEKKAPLYTVRTEEVFPSADESLSGTKAVSSYGDIVIRSAGRHQLDNFALVLTAVGILKNHGIDIPDIAVRKGAYAAAIPARVEIISKAPLVILDGSHNYGSTAALAGVLKKYLPDKKIMAVAGMMADKDCVNSLGNLLPYFDEVITVKPSNPRSMDAEALADIVRSLGVKAQASGTPEDGVKLAFEALKRFDALVVCGSLYLASDVRSCLFELCGNVPRPMSEEDLLCQ